MSTLHGPGTRSGRGRSWSCRGSVRREDLRWPTNHASPEEVRPKGVPLRMTDDKYGKMVAVPVACDGQV
ncbi:MAG: hypothetical protein ACK5RX_12020 [bacterium]